MSAPATEPVVADQNTAPAAPAPDTNEQKAKDFDKKVGIIDKIKKMFKKKGLKGVTAAVSE